MPEMLYLFGPPASGKSTVFAELTRGQEGLIHRKPLAHTQWLPSGMVELGQRRSTFSGTDALAMNAITSAISLIETMPPRLLIGEGDRLAIDRWFDACDDAGYTLWLFYLDTPQSVLADRRAERALLDGAQDRTWVKGRETKAERLAQFWQAHRLDGSKPPAEVVDRMLSIATPFQPAYRGVSA